MYQSGKFHGLPAGDLEIVNFSSLTIGDQDWMIDNLACLPSFGPSTDISDNEAIYYMSENEGTDVTEAKATENYSTWWALYNRTTANICCPDGWHPKEYDCSVRCIKDT